MLMFGSLALVEVAGDAGGQWRDERRRVAADTVSLRSKASLGIEGRRVTTTALLTLLLAVTHSLYHALCHTSRPSILTSLLLKSVPNKECDVSDLAERSLSDAR